MTPRLVANTRCGTGENPLWHPDEGRVYWVDIPAGQLFWYDPNTGEHQLALETEPIGGFTIQEDGALLLFMARGAVRLWRDGQITTVIEEIPAELDSRFNDVIADPRGRVFCGTMSSEAHAGRLYRLDTDGSIRPVLEDIGTSNGMGFTLDGRRMYYTDSRKREIYLFDYDAESGEITNQRVWVTVPEGQGSPDGMTVDAEGRVWSARWNGNRLVRYTADGRVEREVEFPARKVSSLIFGGPDYRTAYVTTAGGQDRASEGPGAGALFAVALGVAGVPEFRSRVRV